MGKTTSKEREARKGLCGFLSQAWGDPICGEEATITHGLMTQTSGALQPGSHTHTPQELAGGRTEPSLSYLLPRPACPPPNTIFFLGKGFGSSKEQGTYSVPGWWCCQAPVHWGWQKTSWVHAEHHLPCAALAGRKGWSRSGELGMGGSLGLLR